MRSVDVIQIVTPKKYILHGLWMGPKKPKRAIIWIHGLGSSLFSKLHISDKLVDTKTAVLAFNNRGHDKVSYLGHVSGKYTRAKRAGAAHEKFVECVDDIQGAINFARGQGVKNIFLAGHSTGCQKSVYWASKKEKGVKGIILLAPMSDYGAGVKVSGKATIARGLTYARKLIKSGKSNKLLPENIWGWPWTADAQRFVSLFEGKGPEEIFTYWIPNRNPKALKSVKIPMLVLLAENDEFADRPAKKISQWFEKHLPLPRHETLIIPKVSHSFRGGERLVVSAIQRFLEA